MKIQKTIKWASAIAAVCLAVFTASAKDMIGVNFVANDNAAGETAIGTGEQDGYVDSLLPTERAGVAPYTMANWMNFGISGGATTLTDSNGSPTAVTMAWQSPGMWHTDTYGTFPGLINPNCKLMDGYLEPTWSYTGNNVPIPPGTSMVNINQDDQPIILLTGLNTFAAAQGGGVVDIILYVGTGNDISGRHAEYWIDSATGTDAAVTDGAMIPTNCGPLYVVYNAFFDGTNFSPVPPTATNDANAAMGQYIDFTIPTNLDGTLYTNTVLIRGQVISGGPSITYAGIQIVALGNANPPTAHNIVITPVVAPGNTIYGGTPVTLSESASGSPPIGCQWLTDGGGGGGLTNIPGATASSLAQQPANTGSSYNILYQCIVSNTYGMDTSAVSTLSVLPGAAPILTSDIYQYSTNSYGFVGGSETFSATFGLGTLPITNQWLFNNGTGYAPVSGASSATWMLTNILSGSTGLYELAATNAIGRSNSSPAHLTALARPGWPITILGTNIVTGVSTNIYDTSFARYVLTNNPWAYWRFEETNDTITSSMQAYDYSGNNFDATYGNSSGVSGSGCKDAAESMLQGQNGPLPPSAGGQYPGFESTNGCAGMANAQPNGYLTVPPLNMNTNTVTFTAWIYPNSDLIGQSSGLLMWRNNSDAAGFGFGTTSDVNTATGRNMACLGYTWNQNSPNSYNWNSGLFPLGGTWTFVAYVINPTTPPSTCIMLAVERPTCSKPASFIWPTRRNHSVADKPGWAATIKMPARSMVTLTKRRYSPMP